MHVSIVIPNFNGEALLKKNLPQVVEAASASGVDVEIIVSDDASKDHSLEFLAGFAKKITAKHVSMKIISSNHAKNTGFSANIARGVKEAIGDILVLLNTDVSPHKNFLKPLLSHFDDPTMFAVGCLDESIEEGRVILRGIGKGKWHRGFMLHSAGKVTDTNTLWVSGGSGAFRKTLWENLGGLEQLYNPFYWEDIDLSYRAQKSGYKVVFEPNSRVIHEHAVGTIKTTYTPFRVQKIAFRNQFFFVWLNITDTNLLFSHIAWLPFHFISAIKDKNKAFLAGFLLALAKLPEVLQKRDHYKKKFSRTDKSILQKFS